MRILPRSGLGTAALVALALAVGGAARADVAVPASSLETFLGLSTGNGGFQADDLTNLNNGPAMMGSGFTQTFTAQAGAVLSFKYDFLTSVAANGGFNTNNDFAFITIPTLADFADVVTLPLSASRTPFAMETGTQTFSVTIATAGTYTLGIGIVNVSDPTDASGLLIDNLSLTSGTIANGGFETGTFSGFATIGDARIVTSAYGSPVPGGTYQALLTTVPEPSSALLLGPCLLGLAARRLRRGRGRR